MNIARHGPLAAAILLAAAPVQAQEPARDPGPARWETSHSITIGDEPVHYNAAVSGITLTNGDGHPAAELWYTAYFRTNGAHFAAGHMMYVEQSLLPQWKETLDRFIPRTSGGSKPVSQ